MTCLSSGIFKINYLNLLNFLDQRITLLEIEESSQPYHLLALTPLVYVILEAYLDTYCVFSVLTLSKYSHIEYFTSAILCRTFIHLSNTAYN